MIRHLLLFVFLFLGFWPMDLSARAVPFLSGRVVDEAGLLSTNSRGQITTELEAIEQKTGAQIVVLLVSSLEGQDIESFSIQVAEAWKLGQKGEDNGLLFLVAKNDRRMRIEVGRGLEGVIPDAMAGRIIDQIATPPFRAGDFDGGVRGVVEALGRLLAGEPGERVLPNRPSGRSRRSNDWFGFVLFLFMFGFGFVRAVTSIRGVMGWVLGLAIAPVVFIIGYAVASVLVGIWSAAVWIVLFIISRLFFPLSGSAGGSDSRGWRHWGGYGGGGGGGWSGGGFSGGGGSFGGGGASGSW